MSIGKIAMENENKQSRDVLKSAIIPLILSIILIGSVIYKIFNLNFFGISFIGAGYLLFLISLFLPLTFVWFPASKKRKNAGMSVIDWILATISFLIPFYLFLHALDIQNYGWSSGTAPMHVKVMCLILLIPVFDATRRVGGTSLAVICFGFATFPLFARYLPGMIGGISFPFWRTVTLHVLGGDSMLGMVMDTVGNVVIGYLLFGVVFSVTKGGDFFLALALSILGKFRGGMAKTAVLASSFFGSISGSVVANVIGTGVVTIPSMKKSGYSPTYAAAVEACASTGGTLMPPVMGSSAFFCAQFLGIPYYQVALAAFIPSVLYYIGLLLQVDGYAARHGLQGIPKEELPSKREILKDGWVYLCAMFILIILIFYRQEARAPFYCTLSLLILLNFKKDKRVSWAILKKILLDSGKSIAQICTILLGVGFIVGSLSITGVAHSFSFDVVNFAGNNLYLLLLFGALASFILGMGMVSSAAYLFLALILAPSLVKLGVYPLAAHLFVMYCGMISFITPPVALGSIAAAGIANAPPMKVGIQSMKLGIGIYFVPFALALNPALVGHGSFLIVALSVLFAIFGLMMLSGSIETYSAFYGHIRKQWRIPLFISGILLLCPSWIINIIGAAIGVIFFFIIKYDNKTYLKIAQPNLRG